MLCTSRDKRLPYEILKQVFQNLNQKEDRKACLLVCKLWNSAAQEYFSREVSIKVNGTMLNDLLEDLSYFGQNVKAIKLKAFRYIDIDELKWRHILNLCPYLTSVCLLNNSNSLLFLKSLQHPDTKLNYLQKVNIDNLMAHIPDVHDFYLQISIQYCQTIASLQIYALNEDPVEMEYGGLYKFISQFPRLTCLKVILCRSYGDGIGLLSTEKKPKPIVDIKNIFEEAPQLKEVKLYDCVVIANDSPDTNSVQLIENRSLTDLKIFADNISISTLRYIISLLKEVEILALIIGNVTTDKDISVEESETILGDLEASTSEMKRVEIKYKYNGQDFYLNMGKKFNFVSCSNRFYRGENYFSSDDDGDYENDHESDYESDYDCSGNYNDDCRWNDCIDDDFFLR